MKKKKAAGAFLIFLILIVLFAKPFITNIKIALLISQEFPQIPIKPLHLITPAPTHQKLEIESHASLIIADLLIPGGKSKLRPALILAMGVRTQEKDKPILLNLANSLSRLGYVVIWPRSERLEKSYADLEEPQIFVDTFNFLENQNYVDITRISYVGFSVGSSTAMVAAANNQIAQKVHSLFFFGGYWDIYEYLINVASKSQVVNNQVIGWTPAEGATDHIIQILNNRNAQGSLGKIFEAKNRQQAQNLLKLAKPEEIESLKKYSPKEIISHYQTPTFILHEKSDKFVPYSHSLELQLNLSPNLQKSFLLVNLFEHVQPQKGTSLQTFRELAKLWHLLYQTISYL